MKSAYVLLFIMFLSLHLGRGAAIAGEPEVSEKKIDFSVGAELRDPFWPVGYVPVKAQVQGAVSVTEEQREKALASIRYGGIIRSGGVYFATVNGRLVGTGDVVEVIYDGVEFKFRVTAISMDGVQLKAEN